jgi:hypothetical protein
MVNFRSVFIILTVLVALTGIVSAQAPTVKPQPNEKTYSVADIYTFKSYTRDSFESAFGVQPPAFNPAKPVKTWFDTTVNSASASYVTLDLNSLKNITLTLSKEDAASVNLPGSYRYPSYIIRPSECLMQAKNAPLPPSQINPLYLSTRAEADKLAVEVGGTVVLATDLGNSLSDFAVACPANEPRAVWEVVFRGKPVSAGGLLANKNIAGVGAPGAWDLTGDTPVWKPSSIPTSSSNYMRVPVRLLFPNEKFSATPFGVYVQRTDMDDPNGGGFLLSDRATLNEILRIVRELQARK